MNKKEQINKKLLFIRNLFFVFLFFASLLLITIYISSIKEQEEISMIEQRKLETFDNLFFTNYLDGKFQEKLEKATSDQFVKRYDLISLKRKLDQVIKNVFVKPSEDEYILTNIAGTSLYQVGNTNYVMCSVVEFKEKFVERYLKKANEINQLAKDYPDIDIYVYYPTQIHETSLFDEKNGIMSYGEEYYRLFSETLEVKHSRLEINNLEDYKNYFYQQDHHWNYQGSYQGYLDILEMMFEGTEKELEPKELVTTNDELLWYGTMGSRTSYLFDSEPFYYYTYDLKEYQAFDSTGEQAVFNMNNIELQRTLNDSTYYYTFLGANNICWQKLVGYDQAKETLLIVGDSYASAIEPLLIQHFSTIYFIQPQDYRWLINNGEYFDYDQFLSENKIDNILFMYTTENYFSDNSADDFCLHR